MIEATDSQPSAPEGFSSFELKLIGALSAEYAYRDENQVEHSGFVHFYAALEKAHQTASVVVAEQLPKIDMVVISPAKEVCDPEVLKQAVIDAQAIRGKRHTRFVPEA